MTTIRDNSQLVSFEKNINVSGDVELVIQELPSWKPHVIIDRRTVEASGDNESD